VCRPCMQGFGGGNPGVPAGRGGLGTGLVVYLSVNAVTHPATPEIRATHLASSTDSDMRRTSVGLLLVILSCPSSVKHQ
jgi:hypothetical protein